MITDAFELYEHHKQVAVIEYYRCLLSEEMGKELTRSEAAMKWVESGNAEKWRTDIDFKNAMFSQMENYLRNKKIGGQNVA